MCLWSPMRNQLATGANDGVCRLWNFEDMNEEKWSMNGDDSSQNSNQISITTAILPHSSIQGEKYKDVTSISWRSSHLPFFHPFLFDDQYFTTLFSHSPDGEYLATGCYDGNVRVWDRHGMQHRLLKGHSGAVFSLKWNKENPLILSGSYDKRAIVWSSQSWMVLNVFSLHSSAVMDLDWKDGDYFATCSSDRCFLFHFFSFIASLSSEICPASQINIYLSSICFGRIESGSDFDGASSRGECVELEPRWRVLSQLLG